MQVGWRARAPVVAALPEWWNATRSRAKEAAPVAPVQIKVCARADGAAAGVLSRRYKRKLQGVRNPGAVQCKGAVEEYVRLRADGVAGEHTDAAIIAVLCYWRQGNMLERVVSEHFQNHQERWTPDVVSGLIAHYGKAKDLTTCRMLWGKAMANTGNAPTTGLVAVMMAALAASREDAVARKLFTTHLAQLDAAGVRGKGHKDMDALLNTAVRVMPSVAEADVLLGEMRARGVAVDAYTLTNLLTVCRAASDPAAARRYCAEHKALMNVFHWNSLLMLYAEAGDDAMFAKVWERLRTQGMAGDRTYLTGLEVVARRAEAAAPGTPWEDFPLLPAAEAAFEAATSRLPLSVNPRCYVLMARVHVALGLRDRAEGVLRTMQQRGAHPGAPEAEALTRLGFGAAVGRHRDGLGFRMGSRMPK